jgi:hypothetical protein
MRRSSSSLQWLPADAGADSQSESTTRDSHRDIDGAEGIDRSLTGLLRTCGHEHHSEAGGSRLLVDPPAQECRRLEHELDALADHI